MAKPFTCLSCQLRQPTISSSRRFLSSTLIRDSSTATQRYAHLTNRTLIRLAGPDAASFLHNIIPAKILGVGTNPVYTAFLSAHGRILNDVFVYPPSGIEQEWFVEVDSKSAGDLMKHLRKHKLRSKFKLERIEPGALDVYYRWPSVGGEGFERGGPDKKRRKIGGQDPRPGMGMRLVEDPNSKSEYMQQVTDGAESASVEDYTIHRMLNGIAEGQSEIIESSALPQESNIDFFGGIDFHKGCYLGQELTIRTHHTGVVRKRILPVQLYDEANPIPVGQDAPEYKSGLRVSRPPSESNMSKVSGRKGRSTGKWLDGVGNIGLALCRLEMMTDIQLTADRTNYDPNEEYAVQWGLESEEGAAHVVRVKPFVPQWLRDGVEQSLRRKEKRPKKAEG